MPDSIDLDTAAFVSLTRDAAVRKQGIDASWEVVSYPFTSALGLESFQRGDVVTRLRAQRQLLAAAKCSSEYHRSYECQGEPDDELKRDSRVRIDWGVKCPQLPPDGQRALDNLRSLSGEPLRALVENGLRARALLPKVEAIAARKRGIPVPPTDDEKREWTCAQQQLQTMSEDLRGLIAYVDAVEAVFKDPGAPAATP